MNDFASYVRNQAAVRACDRGLAHDLDTVKRTGPDRRRVVRSLPSRGTATSETAVPVREKVPSAASAVLPAGTPRRWPWAY